MWLIHLPTKNLPFPIYQISSLLTPKGPLVPKLVLGCVVWSHTIFSFFESFCEDASWNKLRMSANFMILGATVQKLWVFKVFRWTLVRTGMCWNQWERVDHMHKKRKAGRIKKNCTCILISMKIKFSLHGKLWLAK